MGRGILPSGLRNKTVNVEIRRIQYRERRGLGEVADNRSATEKLHALTGRVESKPDENRGLRTRCDRRNIEEFTRQGVIAEELEGIERRERRSVDSVSRLSLLDRRTLA